MIIRTRNESTIIRCARPRRSCTLSTMLTHGASRSQALGVSRGAIPPACATRHPFVDGTSLARPIIDIPYDKEFNEVSDRRRRARVKMLNNEIVFDIPCVVPEYVPPRLSARADRHAQCARSTDSTDSRSFNHASRPWTNRAPWLSGLCKRGTDQ
jgi:hypothetical protein